MCLAIFAGWCSNTSGQLWCLSLLHDQHAGAQFEHPLGARGLVAQVRSIIYSSGVRPAAATLSLIPFLNPSFLNPFSEPVFVIDLSGPGGKMDMVQNGQGRKNVCGLKLYSLAPKPVQ